MKQCGQCGETLHADQFHKRKASIDGLSACCKDCQRAYDRARLHKSDRVEARRAYALDPTTKETRHEAQARWAKLNPVKRAAHVAVGNAIKTGKLVRQPCECGEPKTEAHHDDYSKPLDVRWLCHACHEAWHMAERRAA